MIKNPFFTNLTNIDKAYIITIKGNKVSEESSKKCQESCLAVDMPFEIWDAFDGTSGTIITPINSINETIFDIVKITNIYLATAEVACVLSHLGLWIHCAKINKPIVILEHDAIMIKKIDCLHSYNAIAYLGCFEWFNNIMGMYDIPPFGTDNGNPNDRFILRTHAYAIDPPIAKNLIAHIIQMGIYTSADRMIRADLFNITHQGIYAYDDHGHYETTIERRPGDTAPIINRYLTNQI